MLPLFTTVPPTPSTVTPEPLVPVVVLWIVPKLVTVPAKFLVSSWLLAWDFLDYPLGVHGLAMGARVAWVFRRTTPAMADSAFRRLQFVSASLMSLGHGGNDAQKTMGIITVLLYAHGKLSGAFHVPLWVVLSCQAAMGLGTLMGGWRIVRTMGSKITAMGALFYGLARLADRLAG